MKVLIVENDVRECQRLSELIRTLGHDVAGVVTTGGIDAIARYQSVQPDVVLMELVMPRLNGITAARLLRRREPSAKVVLLASKFWHENNVLASSDVDAVVQKPVNLLDLQRAFLSVCPQKFVTLFVRSGKPPRPLNGPAASQGQPLKRKTGKVGTGRLEIGV